MSSRSSRVTCSFTGCNQTFSRQSDCTRHQDEVHGDPKACPVKGCNWRNAKRKGRLEAHMKKMHSEIYDGVQLEIPDQWHQQTTASSYDYNSSFGAASPAAAYDSTYNTTTQQPQNAEIGYDSQAPQYYALPSSQTSPYSIESNFQSGNASTGTTTETTYSTGSYMTADGQVVYATALPNEHYSSNYFPSSSS